MADPSSNQSLYATVRKRSKLPDVESKDIDNLLYSVSNATILPSADEARRIIKQLKSLVPPVETVYQPSGKTGRHQILLMIAGTCLAGFAAVLLMYPAMYVAKYLVMSHYIQPKYNTPLDFVAPPTGPGAPMPGMIWVALAIFILLSTLAAILSSGITTGFCRLAKNRNPFACGIISACGLAVMITTLGIWCPGLYQTIFGKFEMWELSKLGKTVSFNVSVPDVIRYGALICIAILSFYPAFAIGRSFVRTTKFSESADAYFNSRRSKAISLSFLPDFLDFLCQRDFKSLANMSRRSSFSVSDDKDASGSSDKIDPVTEPPMNCYITLESFPERVEYTGYVEMWISAKLKYKGSKSTGTESQSWLIFSEEWGGRDLEQLAGSLNFQS